MNNNKKLENEEVDLILKEKGFVRIDEYTNNRTELNCECIDSGYRCMIRIDRLKIGNKPKIWGEVNEPNFDYNIPLFLKNNSHNVSYIGYKKISKNNNKRVLVKLKCNCGKEFNVIMTKMINNYYKVIECNDCKRKFHNIKIKRSTKENLKIIEDKGYKIINKNEALKQTVNLTTKVDVIDSDGFKGRVSALLCRKSKHFPILTIRQNKKFFIENVNLFMERNGYKTKCIRIIDIDNAEYICECGQKIILTTVQVRNGKCRCDNCTNRYSSLEIKVRNYLIDNKIDFIEQYKFVDCKDKIPLPFDFYLTNYNICIEVDGKQHYKKCFGNDLDFEKTKNHDNIKNNYCKNNNIRLIRIPYYDFDNNDWKKYFIDFIED